MAKVRTLNPNPARTFKDKLIVYDKKLMRSCHKIDFMKKYSKILNISPRFLDIF